MKQNPAIIAILMASTQAVQMGKNLNQLKLEQFMQAQVDIQMESDPICSSAGCSQYKQAEGPAPPPMDYFVPNFGMDHDVLASENNEKVASALVGHAWAFKTPESWEKYRNRAKDTDYNFDPKLSEDMQANATSMKIAEGQYGNPGYSWGLDKPADSLIQLQSDPICSSAGCTQYKQPDGPKPHPMDYFVPNFGMDHDIVASETDEKIASALVGHNWAFKTPESWEKYRNRAKDADYNFDPELSEDMRTNANSMKIAEAEHGNPKYAWALGADVPVAAESLIQTQDDPCYSSLGECLQTLPPKGTEFPMGYKVPNFGPDPDMVGTMENEKIASTMLNHAWEFNTKKSFEKWRNRAKDTAEHYNFDPELSHDVKITQNNQAIAEGEYGKWDVEKTGSRMGYDYYVYGSDVEKKSAADAKAKADAAAAEATADEDGIPETKSA